MRPLPPRSTLFPYTTLSRSVEIGLLRERAGEEDALLLPARELADLAVGKGRHADIVAASERRIPVLAGHRPQPRSEEHTSELQSRQYLVWRLLLETK